ncbi:MAG: RNA methyltransferase [Bacteroidetes bacterium]|nr:RNA methyltransferase [Bacteroidota bacterium]
MLKYIQSLHLKKFRDQEGRFIAEGDKVVREFLLAGQFELITLCAEKKWIEYNKDLMSQLNPETIFEVNDQLLSRMTALKTANNVLAVFKNQQFEMPSLKGKISLMLDDLQDPGNMGTIIRIADWFGIKHIICSNKSVDCYNPKVVQATMGSLNRVKILYTDIVEFLKKQKEVPVYAATLGGKSIYEMPQIKAGIIIIGNESQGIDAAILKLATHQISIPTIGHAESLNAAVATGIIIARITMGK